MKAQLTGKFSFGHIVVDPKSNAIYLNGIEKRLEPKLIALLCLLAAQGREVISRHEITQAIWPDVVVGEESITRAIFALRNALGDDAKQPRYIETIPKKGYRFLVDAQLIDESPHVDSMSPPATGSFRRAWSYTLSGLGLILAIVFVAWWSPQQKHSVDVESILPLNKMTGLEVEIRLNASGTQLLFSHYNGGKHELYSRDLAAAKDILWASEDLNQTSPVWIDDNTIAYIYDERHVVRRHQGQPPQILYSATAPISSLTMAVGDSENLFFLERENNASVLLKSFNLRNGEQQNWHTQLPELPHLIGLLQPTTQPNTLLVAVDDAQHHAILSLNLITKTMTPVSNHFLNIYSLVAASDHSLIVSGILGASEGIWLVTENQPPQKIIHSSGTEKIVNVQIDTHRQIIFYANLQQNDGIKFVSLRNKEVTTPPELSSGGMDTHAVFAKQDKIIYFSSNRTGYYEIWRFDTESQSVKQITQLNALWIFWFSLSHSEQHIAAGYRSDELHLGLIETETGQIEKRVVTSSARFPLAWSNDDNTIYVSEHQAEINLFRYDTKTLTQSLFAKKAGLYVKAIDNNTVAYVDYDRHALVERNLLTSQEKILHDIFTPLLALPPGKFKLNAQNNGVYAGCQIEWHDKICFYPFTNNNNSPVVVSEIPYWQFFDISKDGGTILVENQKPPYGDIMKIQLKH